MKSKNLVIVAALIISGSISIGGFLAIKYDHETSRSNDRLDFENGIYYKEFKEFGPGTIEIEAVKVFSEDEKVTELFVDIVDNEGNSIGDCDGTPMDSIGKRYDSIHDYYVVDNSWNILTRDNYTVKISGLRKDSRDYFILTSH